MSGVVCFQVVSKAFRAAATAVSTSFSVASWTATMGFSVDGLMVSKVLPSAPFTNSLLMKLWDESDQRRSWWRGTTTSRHECGVNWGEIERMKATTDNDDDNDGDDDDDDDEKDALCRSEHTSGREKILTVPSAAHTCRCVAFPTLLKET